MARHRRRVVNRERRASGWQAPVRGAVRPADPVGEVQALGGGWYLMPDGRKVHGRAAVEAARKGGQ